MRSHQNIRDLRNGETVEVEGFSFRMLEGEIEIGDWYIAERNSGPKLLTAKEFVYYLAGPNGETVKTRPENYEFSPSWINPEENAYPYNWGECVKVELV